MPAPEIRFYYKRGEVFIIQSQKKITTTNPGKFYYNLEWTNSTSNPVTFDSLNPTGANVTPRRRIRRMY